MKKMTQIATAVALATAVAMPVAAAEGEGNVSVTSNYIWRGTTQTGGSGALQGGYDWTADALSYGIWASTIPGSYEIDLYGAYSGGTEDAGWSVGYLYYYIPGAAAQEISIGGNYQMVEGTYYYDLASGNGYTELGASFGDFGVSYGTGVGTSYYGLSYGMEVAGFDVGLTYVSEKTAGAAYALSVGTTF